MASPAYLGRVSCAHELVTTVPVDAPSVARRRTGWASVPAVADAAGFVVLHVACLAVLVVGVTVEALVVAAAVYAVRCFGVAAGFHRYFSHRAFRTGRPFQFVLALLGTLAMQKGVLWWTATHRRHHSVAETPADVHSPHHHSFAYSHCGWFLDPANRFVELGRVRDLSRHRELVWLDRWRIVPIVLLAAGLWLLGPTVFVWAFCVGTVALWHATLSTGSCSHRVGGYRNFDTPDDSRNNRVIAVVLLGEGWHNNHHRSPRAARHGTRRTEPDPIHGVLRLLAGVGLIRDLQPGPGAPASQAASASNPAPTASGSTVRPALTSSVPNARS